MKITFLILISFFLVSCYQWPQEGTGGFAELTHPLNINNDLEIATMNADKISDNLHTAREELYSLEKRGAKTCFPAMYDIVSLQADRTLRELIGGLYLDAQHDLNKLETQISSMKKKVNSISNKRTCSKRYKS